MPPSEGRERRRATPIVRASPAVLWHAVQLPQTATPARRTLLYSTTAHISLHLARARHGPPVGPALCPGELLTMSESGGGFIRGRPEISPELVAVMLSGIISTIHITAMQSEPTNNNVTRKRAQSVSLVGEPFFSQPCLVEYLP